MSEVAPGHVRECPACKAGSPASAGYHVLSFEKRGDSWHIEAQECMVGDELKQLSPSAKSLAKAMAVVEKFIEQEQRRIEELSQALMGDEDASAALFTFVESRKRALEIFVASVKRLRNE